MLHVNVCSVFKEGSNTKIAKRCWCAGCGTNNVLFCYVHVGRWANVQVCHFAFLFPQRDSFSCFRTISLNSLDLQTMLSCWGDVICKERRFDSDSWDWNMEIKNSTLLFVTLFCRYLREHIHTYMHTSSWETLPGTGEWKLFLWMTAAAWQRVLSVCHPRPFPLRTSCFLWQKPPTCRTETNSDSTRMGRWSPRVRQSSLHFAWITEGENKGDIFKSKGSSSGVHRLFEGEGWKEGHFIVRFGSQEGTLAHIFATQEGSLSCFNQAKGAI